MKRLLGAAIASLLLVSAGPALAARTVDIDFDNAIERPGLGWWEDGAFIGAPFGGIADGVLVVQQYGAIACCSPLSPVGPTNYTFDVLLIRFLSPVDVSFRLDDGVIILAGSPDWQTINFAPGAFRTSAGFSFSTVDREVMFLDRIILTAVPEPATWAMMIMGFGLAGAALRRSRTAVAA